MVPPRALPPIFKIALSFLSLLVYRTWMLSKRKTVEIRLWEFEWDPPCRVRRRYSHVVFRMVKPLRKGEGRTNIIATLGRTLGPFGDARAAYEAADQAGLKLGLTLEELEVYMTRERKILKGPRKGEVETRVVPVALFELLDVHETRNFKCADGQCNQAGFLPHNYTPRRAHHLETRFRYRRSAGRLPTPQAPIVLPPPQRSAGTVNGRRRLGRAPSASKLVSMRLDIARSPS
jgi:hypothetical protein